jgi:hypothetical protein
MSTRELPLLTAVWVPLIVGIVGNAAVAAGEFIAEQSAERTQEKSRVSVALFQQWMERGPLTRAAEVLLTRQDLPSAGKGKRRAKPYRLGFSGSGEPGQNELFAVLDFFQTVAALSAAGAIEVDDLSTLMRNDAAWWCGQLQALYSRSEPELDTRRRMQLLHAIEGACILAPPSQSPSRHIGRRGWRALTLAGEFETEEADGFVVRAVISNPNPTPSSVPGVCARFVHQGNPTGHFLFVPDYHAVPELGEIEVFAKLPAMGTSRPSGLRLATTDRDFQVASSQAARFPAIASDNYR